MRRYLYETRASFIIAYRNITISNVAAFISIGLLYAAMFSGKYSFDRFFNETARTEWLQLRLWFTLAAILTTSIYFFYKTTTNNIHIRQKLVLGLVIFFLTYYLVAGITYGDPKWTEEFTKDYIYLLVHLLLIAVMFTDERRLLWFLYIAESCGLILFIFAILGLGNQQVYGGLGWAPFGTTITFHRLEFLSAASALCIAASTRNKGISTIHYIIALLCIYSTYASLSKAAFIAVVCAIAYGVFWLFIASKYKQAAIVMLLAIAASAIFFFSKGALLESRINVATISGPTVSRHIRAADASGPTVSRGRHPRLGIIDISRDEMEKIFGDRKASKKNRAKLLDTVYGRNRENIKVITETTGTSKQLRNVAADTLLEYGLRYVLLYDTTQRISLWSEAIADYHRNKLFGVGPGRYRLYLLTWYKILEIHHYPHNILLEILSGAGAIGLGIFFIVIFYASAEIVKEKLSSPLVIYPSMYLIYIFITAQFGGDISDFRVFLYISVLLLFSYKGRLQHRSYSRTS